MNNKTKKLIIVLLDVTIGIIVELWASNTFPSYIPLLTILFFIFLLMRLIFDWFHETIEEKFFALELERKKTELEGNIKIQKEIQKQMHYAISHGDIEKFKRYKKIEKKL